MMLTSEETTLPTRERLVRAAITLFAERGYRGTSVGEIEAAAGLSPRSGALYKHFASKEDLLEAAIRERMGAIDQIDSGLALMPLGDVHAELTLLCRWALREIGHDQQILRVLMKDGDQFPRLREEFRDRIVRRGHEQAVAWTRWQFERAGITPRDTDALASVLLGSIIYYRVAETLFGEPPGRVGLERFVAAWVDSAIRTFRAHGIGLTDESKEPG